MSKTLDEKIEYAKWLLTQTSLHDEKTIDEVMNNPDNFGRPSFKAWQAACEWMKKEQEEKQANKNCESCFDCACFIRKETRCDAFNLDLEDTPEYFCCSCFEPKKERR